MHLTTLTSLLLLPLLAAAQSSSASSTTTLTSTATLTKTITVSQVVASVTSTYPAFNSSTISTGPTAYGTGSFTPSGSVKPTNSAINHAGTSASASPTSTIPANFMGAATSLNSMYAGSAGVLVMIAAALL